MPREFWKQARKPCMALAPMSGITDAPYRRIIAKYGKPDVMWTGFLPAAGLCSPGRRALLLDLSKTAAEHPIVAQIYGSKPTEIRGAAQLIAELGFDGVDVNMGCPVREIERRMAGAALMRQPALAKEIIWAAKEGAGDISVSVKTRIGYRGDEIEEWLGSLLEARPEAIVIHARTRDEAYNCAARWDFVARAVKLARQAQVDETSRTLIIGNGDVPNLAEARRRAVESGCDGVMIGRRVLGNPWLFNEQVEKADLSPREILEVMLEHTAAFIELYAGIKPLEMMKKHIKAYAQGFEGAAQLRPRLMQAADYAELREITSQFCG